MADVNEIRAGNLLSPAGFVNTFLYETVYGVHGQSTNYSLDFHDIKSGNNGWPTKRLGRRHGTRIVQGGRVGGHSRDQRDCVSPSGTKFASGEEVDFRPAEGHPHRLEERGRLHAERGGEL